MEGPWCTFTFCVARHYWLVDSLAANGIRVARKAFSQVVAFYSMHVTSIVYVWYVLASGAKGSIGSGYSQEMFR